MTVEEIKQNFSLKEELQSRGVEINRSGFCRCIFHKERTASMKLYPNGTFYCFGCGKSGDVLTAVMHLDGLDFRNACRRLSGETLDAASRKRISLKKMLREEEERKKKRRREALDTVRKRIAHYKKIKTDTEPFSDEWAEAVNRLGLEYYKEESILDGEYCP